MKKFKGAEWDSKRKVKLEKEKVKADVFMVVRPCEVEWKIVVMFKRERLG